MYSFGYFGTLSKTDMRIQAEMQAEAERREGELRSCPVKHRLIQYYPGPSMPAQYLCAPEEDVKAIPKVGGVGKLPSDGTAVRGWAVIHGTFEVKGQWMSGVYVPTAKLPTYAAATKLTPTPVTPVVPTSQPPAVTPRPIDALVQFLEQAREDRIASRLPVKAEEGKCPVGYRQTPVTLATGAWCHPCAEGEKLVELQSGEYRCVANEALVGVAPCAEGMTPVKLRGPGDGSGTGVVIACAQPQMLVLKSTVPGVDAEKRKKTLSPAAWIAILGGGGLLLGGALVGIGVAVSRRRK